MIFPSCKIGAQLGHGLTLSPATLSADGSFVAVAETNQFRILRYWLKGPMAGSVDTLIDRLPGFPYFRHRCVWTRSKKVVRK
eukprot:scaffold305679_cov17-Tisochrysis_lutea.AAC.1